MSRSEDIIGYQYFTPFIDSPDFSITEHLI
jgi:hypothetical protein